MLWSDSIWRRSDPTRLESRSRSMVIRQLTLTEYEPALGVSLSLEERDALRALVPDLSILPMKGEEDIYEMKAGSHVGAIALPELAVEIRPKLEVSRLLFLLSYAM